MSNNHNKPNDTRVATANVNKTANAVANSSARAVNTKAVTLRNTIKSLARIAGKPMTWAYSKVPVAVRNKIHAKISALGDRASKSAAAIKRLHARIRNDLAARRNYGYGLLTTRNGTSNAFGKGRAHQRKVLYYPRAAYRGVVGAPGAVYRGVASRLPSWMTRPAKSSDA